MLSLLHISQMSNIVRVIVVISFFFLKIYQGHPAMDKPSTAIQHICGAMGGLFPATYWSNHDITNLYNHDCHLKSEQASSIQWLFLSFSFFFLNTRTMNSFSYYNAHECLQGTKQVRVTGDKFSQQADSCGSNTICAMLKTKKKDRSAFCCFQFSVSCMSGGGVGDFLCSSLTAGLCASSPHTSQAS